MPLLPHAKKALRASQRKTTFNQRVKSRVKTAVENMQATPSAEALSTAFKAIDKAVKRNIFHQNKAAHMKSRLSKLVTK